MVDHLLRLLAVLAHPDDESLGTGGILARYAAEGVETHLITATRGEHGWFGPADDYPGPTALGAIREEELHRAARVLGVREVRFLDYIDGELDQAEPNEVIGQIAAHVRRIRPHVVVTFDPYGLYGHPDHIAISQFTHAAVIAAAQADFAHPWPPHQVSKLYYLAETPTMQHLHEAAFGELVMTVDDIERRTVPWPEWAITTRIDSCPYWRQVWEAVLCHRSQLPGYEGLVQLPEAIHQQLWGQGSYFRSFSFVNGGRQRENDLFAGIRQPLQEGPISA